MGTQLPGTQDWSAQIGEQWRRRREAEEAARRASEIHQRAEAERRGSVYRGLLFAALVASRRVWRGFGIFCGAMFGLGMLLVVIGNGAEVVGF
jgi:hypothetical protein